MFRWLRFDPRRKSPARWAHDTAKQLADHAYLLRRRGEDARKTFRLAAHYEYGAARGQTTEPGRSVLHRSAAWLYVHAGDYERAIEVAQAGLSSETPAEIADELRDVIRVAQSRSE